MEQHKSFTVLCVDDEEMPLFLRKKVLEKAGYDVLAAMSAKGTVGCEKADALLPTQT